MKTKVLIAIDEPELAKNIVYKAVSFLNKNNSEITLLNVNEAALSEKDYFYIEPEKFIKYESEKTNFREIENFLEMRGYDYKGLVFKEGRVENIILDMVKEEKFDLIVLGSHNKRGIIRFLLGSVGYKVSRHAKCSVMLIKPDLQKEAKLNTPYSILIGVDGSKYSLNAIEKSLTLIDRERAEITLLNVILPLQDIIPADAYIYTDISKIIEESKIVSKEILNEAAQKIQNNNFKLVNKYFETGNPAETILREAKKNNTDLIILGSHGRSGISEWFMGSVSARVLDHAKTAVLIIKK